MYIYQIDCPKCGWQKQCSLGVNTQIDRYEEINNKAKNASDTVSMKVWNELLAHPTVQLEKNRPGRGILELPSFLQGRKRIKDGVHITTPIGVKPYISVGYRLGICSSCSNYNVYLFVVDNASEEIIHSGISDCCSCEITPKSIHEEINCSSCSNLLTVTNIGIS